MPGWPIRKNEAGTLPVLMFPIYDADGDLVSAAASLDSERSIDQGTFADCSAEAIEIATSSGIYSLAPTQAELNGDEIAFITKTGTAGAKTAVNVLYTSDRNIDDLAFPTVSGRSIDTLATGEVGIDLDNTQGTLATAQFAGDFLTNALLADDVIAAEQIAANAIGASELATDAIGDAQIATGAIASTAFAAGAIDAAAIGANAITSAEFAQSAADLVWGTAARTLTALGFNLANTDFAAGAIDAAAIAAGAIGVSEAPNLDAAVSTRSSHSETDVWDVDATGRQTQGTFGQAIGDPVLDTDTIFGMLNDLEDGVTTLDVNVASMDANTITAAAVAVGAIAADAFVAGAINAAAIANGAIDAATFAAGAIDSGAIAANAIGASELAADAIGDSQIATGAIASTAFAAGAIDDAAMAADAHDGLFIRDIGSVEASAPVHSITTAILKAVSRIRDNAGTLEIYRTNGSTIHASQTVTVDAALDPVDELSVGV